MWVAFAGGSWAWNGLDGELMLGDIIGPFETWTAACEYLQKSWPLYVGTDEELKEAYADLIRWVQLPDNWDYMPHEQFDAEQVKEASQGRYLNEELLEAEISLYWQTHEVRPNV